MVQLASAPSLRLLAMHRTYRYLHVTVHVTFFSSLVAIYLFLFAVF